MECLAPLLLFVPRLRWLGALGLTGFHIGIHLCMTVNWFLPIAVIGAGVAMLPDWLLQRLDHRMVPLFNSLQIATAGEYAHAASVATLLNGHTGCAVLQRGCREVASRGSGGASGKGCAPQRCACCCALSARRQPFGPSVRPPRVWWTVWCRRDRG